MPLARKKRIQPMLPLASMGDIAFLLIIFFMLVAKFMKNVNVDLEKPQSEEVQTVETARIEVTVDADGVIRLQGIECGAAELGSAIDAMVGSDREQTVEVTIDKRLSRDIYMPVMEGLAESGAKIMLTGEQKR